MQNTNQDKQMQELKMLLNESRAMLASMFEHEHTLDRRISIHKVERTITKASKVLADIQLAR